MCISLYDNDFLRRVQTFPISSNLIFSVDPFQISFYMKKLFFPRFFLNWTIYRGPSFLAVLWFGSTPAPSLPPTQEDCEREADGRGRRGRAWSRIIWPQESLALCKIVQSSLLLYRLAWAVLRWWPSWTTRLGPWWRGHTTTLTVPSGSYSVLFIFHTQIWLRHHSCSYTAKEVRKGRWESNINVLFPFMYSQKFNCCFQNRIIMFGLPVPTLIYCICEKFIYFHDQSAFCCREICGPILGKYKSLTDTWMWKLGLRPRNSQKRNT